MVAPARCVRRLGQWLVGAACLMVVTTPVAAQQGQVVLVLDGSNSMWGRLEGTEKIVVARDVLGEVLSELPADLAVGLAAYGHRREGDCADIEVLLPPDVHSRATVEEAIGSVVPTGMTPITAALEQVAGTLDAAAGRTHLVLVSDGLETCGGDPCAAARALRERGIDLRVHVVGFDVSVEEGEQLACIAEGGGGRYVSAGTAVELTEALTDIRDTVAADVASAAAGGGVAGLALPEADLPDEPLTEGAYWRVAAGDEVYEGRLSRFFILDGHPMIQLINRDAVNVGLAIDGDMNGERSVTYAFFGEGRGPLCERVGEADSFRMTFEPAEDGWLAGRFSGRLACPDYELMPVAGVFHIEAPEGRR